MLRDSILQARDLKEREIEIPEWGGVRLLVRGMTGEERSRHNASLVVVRGTETSVNASAIGKANVEALISCVLDPDTRNPVFEPADRDALMKKSADVLQRLVDVMNELSGTGQSALPAAEKN